MKYNISLFLVFNILFCSISAMDAGEGPVVSPPPPKVVSLPSKLPVAVGARFALAAFKERKTMDLEPRVQSFHLTRDREGKFFMSAGMATPQEVKLSQIFCKSKKMDGLSPSVEIIEDLGRKFNAVQSCVRPSLLSDLRSGSVGKTERARKEQCLKDGLVDSEYRTTDVFKILNEFSSLSKYSFERITHWGKVSWKLKDGSEIVEEVFIEPDDRLYSKALTPHPESSLSQNPFDFGSQVGTVPE